MCRMLSASVAPGSWVAPNCINRVIYPPLKPTWYIPPFLVLSISSNPLFPSCPQLVSRIYPPLLVFPIPYSISSSPGVPHLVYALLFPCSPYTSYPPYPMPLCRISLPRLVLPISCISSSFRIPISPIYSLCMAIRISPPLSVSLFFRYLKYSWYSRPRWLDDRRGGLVEDMNVGGRGNYFILLASVVHVIGIRDLSDALSLGSSWVSPNGVSSSGIYRVIFPPLLVHVSHSVYILLFPPHLVYVLLFPSPRVCPLSYAASCVCPPLSARLPRVSSSFTYPGPCISSSLQLPNIKSSAPCPPYGPISPCIP